MSEEEIIERLEKIAKHAVHVFGEEPFFMSLDDGIAIHEAIDILKTKDVPHWISVTERLPVGGDKSGDLCGDIWMLFDDGSVFCGWMNGCTETAYYLDGYHDFVLKCPISRVRAWQQKPEPPKEET